MRPLIRCHLRVRLTWVDAASANVLCLDLVAKDFVRRRRCAAGPTVALQVRPELVVAPLSEVDCVEAVLA